MCKQKKSPTQSTNSNTCGALRLPLSTSLSINNQQSEALWSLWSCDLSPLELTSEQPVLRGEPGSALKGGEVPMRKGTREVQTSKTPVMVMRNLKAFNVLVSSNVQDQKSSTETCSLKMHFYTDNLIICLLSRRNASPTIWNKQTLLGRERLFVLSSSRPLSLLCWQSNT